MKILKKIVLIFVGLILLLIAALWISGNGFILTGISRTYLKGHPTANIDDHSYFNTRTITAGQAQAWPLAANYAKDNVDAEFKEYLVKDNAAAFLVAHKGALVSENYFDEYSENSQTNSFSMAKTVITLLVGIAIEEGYIESLDQKIVDFFPEFQEDPKGVNATVGSLSSMSSGYNWDESYYNPFSPTVELYYGPDVESFLLERNFSHEVDSYFYYSSASTQLLTILLSRALQAKNPDATVSDYLSEKLWIPLGMDADALWHLDGEGMELGYCCLNTNARNFAKLGQLMLQKGTWNDQQILPATFIEKMHTPKFVENYGYATWLGKYGEVPYYFFLGHLGQYIIVVPAFDLVIVRLGENHREGEDPNIINRFIEEALQLSGQ